MSLEINRWIDRQIYGKIDRYMERQIDRTKVIKKGKQYIYRSLFQ